MIGEFVKSNINNNINSSKECILSRPAILSMEKYYQVYII
jgi:hypothetical protein